MRKDRVTVDFTELVEEESRDGKKARRVGAEFQRWRERDATVRVRKVELADGTDRQLEDLNLVA